MSRIITRKHYGYGDWRKEKERKKKEVLEGKDGRIGHVYIFKLYGEYYKIGCTTDILKRMKALQASCPTIKCVWSAHVRDMLIAEQDLHKKFHGQKVEREIFILTPQDIIKADQIAEKYR